MHTNENQQTEVMYYHGTKAHLVIGELLLPGFMSNFGTGKYAKYVYFAAATEAAIWGAELAQGDGPGRIYIVEPVGYFEDDPNLTDKKFPGNPTKSYRTKEGLKVVGELKEWQGHTAEQLAQMRAGIEKLRQQGLEAIED